MSDRRQAPRRPVDIFFNKFLDGYPYLCRAVDVSRAGVLVETYSEPEVDADQFPVELRFPDDSETLWLWARRVRREGTREALEFVSMSDPARQRLHSFVVQPA
jgi:hypothetical protein